MDTTHKKKKNPIKFIPTTESTEQLEERLFQYFSAKNNSRRNGKEIKKTVILNILANLLWLTTKDINKFPHLSRKIFLPFRKYSSSFS